ncbi:MAG: acetylornithine transaminase [Armatimonadota bacterium]|nr:acetylornithine transaminase [Armatimonadota bacterium]MDW8155217.1 acetylornithine transaminase [Armatimonadota bacterium]
MDTQTVLEWSDRYLFRNYRRAAVAFVRGQGARLWDLDGREYLDFVAGIAVTSLGHGHPVLVRAVCEQVARYVHVSNLYHIPEQAKAARLLAERSGLDRVFFCNSGAEANEAAIKLARKWAKAHRSPQAYEIVVAHNSFHGRTLATVAATGNPRYQQGFDPLPEGFRFVPYNDLAAAQAAVGPLTCAVLMEPVQGEGGVIPADPDYLRGLQDLCRQEGILFMLDEVQTGVGRTGAWFAFQRYGLQPDVVTLAKGLGGGVPVGAVLAREDVAAAFAPGDHGSTFGGNALAAAAVCAVLETLEAEGLVDHAARVGDRLQAQLRSLAERHPSVREVRGVGLLVAVDLEVDAGMVEAACRERGLLVNAVRPRTLRLCPPLVVSAEEVDQAVEILEQALGAVGDPAAAGGVGHPHERR